MGIEDRLNNLGGQLLHRRQVLKALGLLGSAAVLMGSPRIALGKMPRKASENSADMPGLAESSEFIALAELTKTVSRPGTTRSLLVTHVMPTAIEYIELVNSVFPVSSIVAIPYSANPDAVSMLTKQGYKVVVPNSVEDTFVKAREEAIFALSNSKQPFVIQEVGGYFAEITKELSNYPHFLGIIEDTNNGHWRYERTKPHACRVLSMAQSPLKYVEDTIIGDNVIYSVERILREEFSAVFQGSRCAVVGFGKIGRSTAVALKGREAVVSIYDIDPAKTITAKVEGYHPLPLHNLLSQAEIIVGCTGQTSIRAVDIPFIRDGAILASASSKDIEFALLDFSKTCKVDKQNELIWKYIQPNGKSFYVLYKGSPVNFRDRSILGSVLDLIYSELFVCIREVAEGRAPIDFQMSPPSIQNEVGKVWLRVHSAEYKAATDDKIWDYPESIALGLPELRR